MNVGKIASKVLTYLSCRMLVPNMFIIYFIGIIVDLSSNFDQRFNDISNSRDYMFFTH